MRLVTKEIFIIKLKTIRDELVKKYSSNKRLLDIKKTARLRVTKEIVSN